MENNKSKIRKRHSNQNKIKNIISTTLISVMSLILISYTFLIVDKKVKINEINLSLEKVVKLNQEITYLDGKYEEINTQIKNNNKLQEKNKTLEKANKIKKNNIDDLENKIGKMEK